MFVDNALKDRVYEYKVAMIVLAIIAGLALIAVIVLIRYFIVRQSTSSQYHNNAVLFCRLGLLYQARIDEFVVFRT